MATNSAAGSASRFALLTGGNTGIGRVTARELARAGYKVFVACRSEERARPVLDEVRALCGEGSIENLPLDLGNLDSVRECARGFLARGLPLHLLVNNAGQAGARGLTASGFELAFGINHVGHFLLTQLLLQRLRESAPSRVVTVASRAHYRAAGIDWDAVRRPTAHRTGLPEYCVSKLSNVLFSSELSRRLAGSRVSTYALHPGVVATDIWRQAPWPLRKLIEFATISPERGAQTSLYCALSPAVAADSGLYYDRCRPVTPSAPARDAALAAELWRRSEAWTA